MASVPGDLGPERIDPNRAESNLTHYLESRLAAYQRPRCTTSPNGRRLGRLIGASGRSAG